MNLEALLRYINERRVRIHWKDSFMSGFSSVRGTEPSIQDTFFAMACLRMLNAASPDDEIVSFICSHDHLDLSRAYYAAGCLRLAGCMPELNDGKLEWRYRGEHREIECFIPQTSLIRYFEYDLYGMYGSSIFSSSLGTLLKRLELGAVNSDEDMERIVRSAFLLLEKSRQLVRAHMALEILDAIDKRGFPVKLPESHVKNLSRLLESCETGRGYTPTPESTTETLESTYAGCMIARHLKKREPQGLRSFVDLLQNDNGGFRRSPFGGISTLEHCYLALRVAGGGRDITNMVP
ncbi:MAG: hypothetical protein NQU42_04565 [Methanothrix sp.]|uniref:hypothetical protein n=1 Tax=Methanothrix sp. TaxID=90426 RepID=UPI0025F29BA6|nr:hypothetical protein [Methanothrix sp.]MCQ8903347.1 hypothetical protein [Methanothrix sp.]